MKAELDPKKHIMIIEKNGASLVYRKDKGWFGWTVDFVRFSKPYHSAFDASVDWDPNT